MEISIIPINYLYGSAQFSNWMNLYQRDGSFWSLYPDGLV